MSKQPNPQPKKRLSKGVLITLASLALLVSLAFSFRSRVLTALASYLIADDGLTTADMIYVLNGDINTRPFHASDLYSQGLAPVIVIARVETSPAESLGLIQNETDISVGIMERLGVPAEAIIALPVAGGVTSTYDEAIVLHDYILAEDIHSVIIVTSSFHTRRAGWIFRRVVTDLSVEITLAAAPHTGFDQTDWWTSEAGLIALNNEYIKPIHYYLKYR